MEEKILYIESQILDTETEHQLMRRLIEIAAEAGYTKVRDVWGYHYKFGEAYDESTMEEMLQAFKCKDKIQEPLLNNFKDDLPF